MTGERDPRYKKFFELFNREEFFEAHEVLEDLWRETSGPERSFYQGLIQIAAAFVHVQRKNPAGAQRLFETASKYLESFPGVYGGLELKKLLSDAKRAVFSNAAFPKVLGNFKGSDG